MKQVFFYSLKIWLTALILTPALSYLIWKLANSVIAYLNRNRLFDAGIFYGTDAFKISNAGRALFKNTWYYLFYFIFIVIMASYFQSRVTQPRFLKLILTCGAIILTLIPFKILQVKVMGIVFNEQLAWIMSFAFFYIAGIWFYDLKAKGW